MELREHDGLSRLIDQLEAGHRTRAHEPVPEPPPTLLVGALAHDLDRDDLVAPPREIDLEIDHLSALEPRQDRGVGHREIHGHRGHQPRDVVVLDQHLRVLAIDVLDDAVSRMATDRRCARARSRTANMSEPPSTRAAASMPSRPKRAGDRFRRPTASPS